MTSALAYHAEKECIDFEVIRRLKNDRTPYMSQESGKDFLNI
jgi:hypothetical protein